MDCCNYVQPYPTHGHFYHQQQQHNFCYDNTNAYGNGLYGIGGGIGGAHVSDSIEANASRYNRLPLGYPTDYVYNPKEARLRKAMREQSRELSRQTILQTAIASATGNSSVVGPGCGVNGVNGNISPSTAAGTTNFLNHPINCQSSVVTGGSIAAASVSSLPGSPSFNTANRIINPWFPATHGPSANHLKPILSPRVMTVAQHQQHQQQQQQHRTFDKTKEVLRKQAGCAAGGVFSSAPNSGFPTDFSTHGNPGNLSSHQSGSHEANDYCVIGEFSDGQKWHPYQNGPSPYHSRAGGALTKMGTLHPGMQSTNAHAHPGWNQFCTVPLSTISRAPRHMVFLQEQQQSQHCGYPEDMQIPYMQNKHMEISHRHHPSYSQQEHQSKLQSSSISPLNMSQLQEPEKAIEDGPRWESNGGPITSSPNENSMPAMSIRARRENELKHHHQHHHHHHHEHEQSRSQNDAHQQLKNREQHRYDSSSSPISEMKHKKSSTSVKQPLPGFHQAFGSTEIGRFSRSEFFANMVGESSNNNDNGSNNNNNNDNNVSNENSRNSSNSNNHTIDTIDTSIDRSIDLDESSTSSNNNNDQRRANSMNSSHNQHNNKRRDRNQADGNSQIGSLIGSDDDSRIVQAQCHNDATMTFDNSLATNYYNDPPVVDRSPGPSSIGSILGSSTMPRWHSPYVSAIGSEI